MHEGDGDEEMMRVVSNGTRFRVPSHARARSLTHSNPPSDSQHSICSISAVVITPSPWTLWALHLGSHPPQSLRFYFSSRSYNYSSPQDVH